MTIGEFRRMIGRPGAEDDGLPGRSTSDGAAE